VVLNKDENELTPHPDPLPRRSEEKKSIVPSFLMGEGEDEGEIFVIHDSLYFFWMNYADHCS
jgi:hypothetical protein